MLACPKAVCYNTKKRIGMNRAVPLSPADDSCKALRQEWLRLGHVVESPFSRFLPWSGYYMVAERPSIMRKFPDAQLYPTTYGDSLLFDGDPCASGRPLMPADDDSWAPPLSFTLMLHYVAEPPRGGLPPWVLDVGSSPHKGYCSAFAWPEHLFRILLRFPSRGIHTALPVTAATAADFPYIADGTYHIIPPPPPESATAVDAALHTILIGSGETQTVLPLMLDDSHTLDPAFPVIQYFARVMDADLHSPVYHNFLLLSDAVVQALLAADPQLVFFPILIARGSALRNLCAQKVRISTLTSYEEVAPPYDAIAEWCRAHLPPSACPEDDDAPSLLRDKLYNSLCRACKKLAPSHS